MSLPPLPHPSDPPLGLARAACHSGELLPAAEETPTRSLQPALLMVSTVATTLGCFLLPFGHHFRRKGWRVDAMASGVLGSAELKEAYDRLWEIRWTRNPLDPRNLTAAMRTVREVVRGQKYDIVHVHTPVAAFVTRCALRNMRREGKPKVVYTAHGFHFHRGGGMMRNYLFRTLERIAGRWTDYLVVINREDAEAAHRYRIVPADRIEAMPGIGVDLQNYGPSSAPSERIAGLRRELGLDPDDALFTVVAEFTARKRHRDILFAFQRLARPNTHLALAGDGPLRRSMEVLAGELGITGRVHFLGFRRDVPVLMRAAAAVLLASQQEGLPRCVMESMCLQTPVIGTRIRGTEELLEDGCGLTVEVGDRDGLAQAMAWILDHPQLSGEMAERAWRRMHDYQIGEILKRHEALYEQALQ